jgi:CheY-like chemotaxis protein
MLKRMLPALVSLEVRRAPEAALIDADPDQIRQCLLNLAINARDAMPHGGTLEISVASRRVGAAGERGFRLSPGRYFELLVRDTGQGMDDETRERIFEPFFSTKDAQRGSGLGLALVRGIVEQGGGGIHVESAPGKGSSFRILWPAAEEARHTERSGPPREHRDAPPPSILLVEDDEVVRRFMLRCLEGAGLSVLVAADGEEALELAGTAEAPPGLLVTDIVLPRIDGSSLARRLRERWPDLRVLYTSGVGRGTAELPGSAPSRMLAKPFTPAQLLEAVRTLLAS